MKQPKKKPAICKISKKAKRAALQPVEMLRINQRFDAVTYDILAIMKRLDRLEYLKDRQR